MGKIENSIGDMKNDIMKEVEKLYMGKGMGAVNPACSKWGPGSEHSQIPRAQLFANLSPGFKTKGEKGSRSKSASDRRLEATNEALGA